MQTLLYRFTERVPITHEKRDQLRRSLLFMGAKSFGISTSIVPGEGQTIKSILVEFDQADEERIVLLLKHYKFH